jgi:hypothetical protein
MSWWYFDDSKCRAIVFRPKIVNSTSNDDRYGRGMAFVLMSRAHEGKDSESKETELTTMRDNSRPSRPHSKPIPVAMR